MLPLLHKNSTFGFKTREMRILLLGEFSNLHWTLACGLRALGHEVVVASSGDQFKSYQRDIALTRSSGSVLGTIKYLGDVFFHFSSFKGFDVVQIINPCFLDLKAGRIRLAFEYLKRHNGKVFLGAFGDDYFWLKACLDKQVFRYSEFDIPERDTMLRNAQKLKDEWISTEKEDLNKYIADKSDGIIACLYEYFVAYQPFFEEKLAYIPAPIHTDEILFVQRGVHLPGINFFIGIQKSRSEWKGTDVMLRALLRVQAKYPEQCFVKKAESVPYAEYVTLMDGSDIILDQLYSYTPAMNALTAMAQGLVVVGGGEPENYEIIGETELRPIINVLPSEEEVYRQLEKIILEKEKIPELSQQSRLYVERHHHYLKVAQQYIDFWTK
ncbi:MAG: glycosyltransferase family 4 protein [Bacteroidetes bacterium]|nr:glycosyltransferase family 4 protein [Bacteroidota bacterium]